MTAASLGWGGIVRLGLVQTALGAVVVLTTSTLNRVMVVELALPALLPGLLVALHYAVQITRPRMGHGSDVGGRRTPWILGGMATLCVGGVLAAWATTWMENKPSSGIALAAVAFLLIGLGVSASGTSLLALLAKRVPEHRRGPAATVVWLMMILGFAVTAGVVGKLLDPYTPQRLLAVSGGVSVIAMLTAVVALWRVEPPRGPQAMTNGPMPAHERSVDGFRAALSEVWAEPAARRFTVFVFLSMLAYSSQDLILEPFAGLVFGYTPGESTALSGIQHGGVLIGMLLVAGCTGFGPVWMRDLGKWAVGGCLLSALALGALALSALVGPPWPLRAIVAAMGLANGLFSIAAIASMMQLAGQGKSRREGTRVGLWGAAQAMAFGIGGMSGAAASDLARWMLQDAGLAYASVFALEALLFVGSAILAWQVARLTRAPDQTSSSPQPTIGEVDAAVAVPAVFTSVPRLPAPSAASGSAMGHPLTS